ncbi:MAG: ABC transporter substrate-binding protein [Clostridiales bacterium]|nr:ABC transporter substrate-binding protein [Clostridiales bacterium]
MRKITSLLLISILILGMFTGCKLSKTRVVTDCSGTKVEIPDNPRKVVVTSPGACAFMYAMGLGDRVTGFYKLSLVNYYAHYAHGDYEYISSAKFDDIDRYEMNPNAEDLIDSGADLVILEDAEYAKELRNKNINAICFHYTNKDELYFAIDMLGEIFGSDAKEYAERWKAKLESTIDTIADYLADHPELDRCNVLWIESVKDNLETETTRGLVEFSIQASGGDLMASSFKGFEEIDPKTALTLNPDTILIDSYDNFEVLINDPLWQEVPAVSNDRTYPLSANLVLEDCDIYVVELPLILIYLFNTMYHPESNQIEYDEIWDFCKEYDQAVDEEQVSAVHFCFFCQYI